MTINCLGNLLSLNRPKVMGILNLTPDSFYDGGRYNSEDLILKQVSKMLDEGATFIDLGAYSSRPGASSVSEEEELGRLLPVLKLVLKHFQGILISIDTYRSNVAEQALDLGAAMVNDISAGGMDPKMMPLVSTYQAPYIMMHMKGTPEDMQSRASYQDIQAEVMYYFSERIARARSFGISDCILDPGFGFAKTLEQNFELLQELDKFALFGVPILTGISRKSMIYKLLDTSADRALNGTTALHMAALIKGVQILRVHDVLEAIECIALWEALEKKY